ncbi:MAG: fumarate hydratase [Arhodomonas sp.]|nr:fumarate hydratase [Arhodomonas sp.]
MCAPGHRPICQDTGIVTVFLKVGMNVRWEADDEPRGAWSTRACAAAYTDPDNTLRASGARPIRPANARNSGTTRRPVVIMRAGPR